MLKNEFVKTSVGTMTLGEKLKKLRGERRLSLGEISRHTKIPLKYLEYLDEGAYEKLPVDVYVKGFLRNYADFLGIDEKILIRHYEKENGIQNNLDKKNRKKKEEPRKTISVSYFVLTPKIIIVILLALLIGGGIFYLYREIGYISDEPKLVIFSPEDNVTVSENSIYIEGVTDRDAKIYINDQPILTNDEGNFKEEINLQPGTNVVKIKSLNRFNKETFRVLTIQSEYQLDQNLESGTGNTEIVLESGKLEIEIRVSPGPVWISVESDDNLVFSGSLPADDIRKFTAKDKIMINTSQGDATFVKFNGKDLGALGNNHEPINNVVFTPETKY